MKIIKIIGKVLIRIIFTLLGASLGFSFLAFWFWYRYDPLEVFKPYDFAKVRTEAWQPIFAFMDLKTDEPFTIADAKKEIVFVNLWATWCGPCLEEMPSIEKLKNRFKGKPVRFIIATYEDAPTVKKFPKIKKWDLPYYTYNQDNMPLTLTPTGYPTTFLVVNGEVVYSHVGMADWNSPEFVETLQGYIDRIQK